MCLIIAPGKDGKPALLPRDVFDFAFKRNDDGFGAMWVEGGRVKHFKTLGLTADQMYASMEEYVERHPDVIFHMRLRTHGEIVPGLVHPFRILHKNRHGKDLFMMHNGVMGGFGEKLSYGQSDTTAFKDKVLVPLLTRDPDALDDPAVWDSLNKLTSGSRLVFMDSDGKTYFTSPSSWNDRYGVTCSNTYMLPSPPSKYSSPGPVKYEKPGLATPTSNYVYYRKINNGGVLTTHWCSSPKEGYVRTEAGGLYKDHGPNTTIWHIADHIPKESEKDVLGLSVVTIGTPPELDPLDDDVPWETKASSPEESGPAPVDARLRYARLVHNAYGGTIASRVQLLADLIGMNDNEMGDFVMEDPETSLTVMAELVEMILQYNNALWEIDPNHPSILNADTVINQGLPEYHKQAMKEISALRAKEYAKKLDEVMSEDQQQENSTNKKAKKSVA